MAVAGKISTEAAEYERTNQNLEAVRLESRAVRAELIEAILCDKKDVLSQIDMKVIENAFYRFCEVQKRLSRAFFDNATASARFIAQCGIRSG